MARTSTYEIRPPIESFAKIKVIGVGGAGSEAVNRMIEGKLKGVEFIVLNTDAQALHQAHASRKIHLGKMTTRGLGAGMDPELGRRSAEESQEEIHETLKGSDMVFITCGLGGGTGTGAAPIVADIARDVGALVVGVVTKPFGFEGLQRRQIAEGGLKELEGRLDALVTIPNDRILSLIDKKTSLLDAFRLVDEVLKQGVQGISEIITVPGIINVDFADVKSILAGTGSALMGVGKASGENRSVDAARSAIESPLLELSIAGAKGVLFTVSGGPSLTMHEVNEAAKVVTQEAAEDSKVIWGAVYDESLGDDEVKVTVIASGFGEGRRPQVMTRPFGDGERTAKGPDIGLGDANLWQKRERPVTVPRGSSAHQTVPKEKQKPAAKPEEDLEIPAFIRKKMI